VGMWKEIGCTIISHGAPRPLTCWRPATLADHPDATVLH